MMVHLVDELVIRHVHVVERLVAQDAGVVHQDVQPAPGVHRRVDDALGRGGVGHRIVIGNGFAAGGLDLRHHLVGHRVLVAASVDCAARIVHHHLGAARRQQHRVRASKPGAGAGDDRHPVVVTDGH